jgi:TonB family protein
MICDGMVTERAVDSRTYAHSLLRLAGMVAIASRASTVHAIGIFDANILEKRIMRMNLNKRQVSWVLKYGLIVPATLFLLSVAVGAAATAVVIEPQSPSQNSNQASPYGHIYKVGKDVTPPVVRKSVEAQFPKSAQGTKVGFNAIVLIRLIVDAEGMPRDVHISRSYNADFDAEAIKAVKQYQFKPAERMGKPVAVAISIEVDFKKY